MVKNHKHTYSVQMVLATEEPEEDIAISLSGLFSGPEGHGWNLISSNQTELSSAFVIED
mgnify:CR=1 FL=1